ncbi:MAG TPA: ATP-binding protein [Thermoanaerobaculia bacterium]|jgi:hypothetical protein|nr:ATP-binding protein [Thermoanaerobaculia bacterium]
MNTTAIEELLNEEESTSLDFKRDQYPFVGATDDQKSELLKDILAFANAWRRSDAFILIGVAEVRGGRSVPVGVSAHLDDAILQQFVNSKVQRPVAFSYQPANLDEQEVGVLVIPLQDRPIYLKKDYGRLRKGTVYIRRGSSTAEATPDEVAKMGVVAAGLARPKLSLVGHRVKERETQIVLGIENEMGASAARAPYLSFDLPEGFTLAMHGLDGNGSDGLPQLPEPGSQWRKPKFAGTAAQVVHGGTTHWVTRIATNANLTQGTVRVAYEVAAENAELTRGIIDIDVMWPS